MADVTARNLQYEYKAVSMSEYKHMDIGIMEVFFFFGELALHY